MQKQLKLESNINLISIFFSADNMPLQMGLFSYS